MACLITVYATLIFNSAFVFSVLETQRDVFMFEVVHFIQKNDAFIHGDRNCSIILLEEELIWSLHHVKVRYTSIHGRPSKLHVFCPCLAYFGPIHLNTIYYLGL
jgi:uncharacterized protein YcsI (UPF0317 family)